MNNAVLFLNKFLEYGMVFVIFIAVIIVFAIIGINIRKSKNAKLEQSESNEN